MTDALHPDRRTFLRAGALTLGALALRPGDVLAETKSRVFFTRSVTPESLIRIYEALSHPLRPRVAVKISSGEPGGHNFLQPALIAPLVQKLDGTIVECCTAYKGPRRYPKDHREVMKRHGFAAIAPCDILDEDGEMSLPVRGGFHLKADLVGSRLQNYGSVLMLSHFKGHAMGGFGGALKNMSIGLASSRGKARIHSAGCTDDTEERRKHRPEQDHFLESMADACRAVADFTGPENLVYINVAARLSIDCDCDSHPHEPEMADLGIFGSLDPVALDQACHDAVLQSPDPGKASLIRRMEELHAVHILEAAEKLGLGTRRWELVTLS